MHISEILSDAARPTFSLEFFPPQSPGARQTLEHTLQQLAPLRPAFASVTYGAGGGTRGLTCGLVEQLQRKDAFDPVPHLTCVGHTEADIMEILTNYASSGVSNVLALRGDLPAGESEGRDGDFPHAADLVRFIQQFNERGLHPDPRGFGIGVACFPEGHPATPNRIVEMDHLKAKVDAGADWLCTQAFFDNHHFHVFRDCCSLAKIDIPLLAGILPLTTATGMKRMAELAGGMSYPANLLRALTRAGEDPEAFRRIVLHHAAEQCTDLLNHNVDGIHLYTLNQAAPVLGIMGRLGVTEGEVAGYPPGIGNVPHPLPDRR